MKNTFQFLILIIWDKRALRFYYLIRFRFITLFGFGLLPDLVSFYYPIRSCFITWFGFFLLPDLVSFYYLIRFRFMTRFGFVLLPDSVSVYYLIRFRFITWFGLVCGGNVTLSLNSSASTQSKTNFESLSKMAALRFKFKDVIFIKIKLQCQSYCFIS